MKKLLLTIISLTITVLFAANSFAQTAALQSGSKVKVVGDLKGVEHSIKNGKNKIAVSLSGYSSYNVLRLKSPDRIVIDVYGVDAPGGQKKIDVNNSSLLSVRYARFDDGIFRVVLDITGSPEYKVDKAQEGLVIWVYNPGESIGEEDNGTETTEDETGGQPASGNDSSNLPDRGDSSTAQRVNVINNFYIEHLTRGNTDEISLCLSNYRNYSIMRLTGPDRIVIDIPGIKLPAKQVQVDINRSVVKSIRYAQFEKNTGRIVLDVSGQSQYSVKEMKDRLVISVDNAIYSNFVYHNNGDRIYFTLKTSKLTEGGEKLKKNYTESYDATGKKYTITFPSEFINLKSGTLTINDGILNSVRIANNTAKKTTSIIFDAKDRFKYLVFSRPDTNDTTITILKPAEAGEKLVVIDAGHGGKESGAVYGSLLEKDLNLDIALRLNRLLTNKKIKTYMIREDDSYVALYERAYIANTLNATLFLSIHNNSTTSKNVSGTETLYYPPRAGSSGFNGKVFAQIIQEKLLGRLGTVDRKIKERPNLVVLKATAMPSALAEIAFMTNSTDRSNLQKPTFRQKAAQALCDAIVQALEKIK